MMKNVLIIYRIFCEEFGTGKRKTLYIKTNEKIDEGVSDEGVCNFINVMIKPNVDFTVDHICVEMLGKQDFLSKEIL